MKLYSLMLIIFLMSSSVFAHSDVLVQTTSDHSVSETIDRLENIVKDKGMRVFTRVDHEAGAKKVGMSLPPSQVLIFGNPKLGTKLMNCEGAIALDLPIRVAVWEDNKGKVHVAYNAPSHLKKKYHVKGCDPVFDKMTNALRGFVGAATR